MRRFWLPDHEKKLIAELQRQQNSAQFCDTLLQTEGISVPTHSSVLGALSHPLSQRLSASPAPPAGQKRRLQLPTVKPQTLLKLVGLLYSGELDVSSAVELRDVLAAAHSLGLPDLVEGEKFEVKSNREVCKEPERGRVDIEKRDMQIQVTPRSLYVSTGTQTVIEDINRPVESSQPLGVATKSSLLTSLRVSKKNTSSSTTCPANSSERSDGESTHEQSSDCTTSASSSLLCQSGKMAWRLSPSESPNCSRLHEEEVDVSGTSAGLSNVGPVTEEDGQRRLSEERERTNHENTERGSAEEDGQVSESVAIKHLEKMQEMMETTQISIKVKLRRRQTKEGTWEVVNNMQDTDALSGVSALIPDNFKRPQENLAAVQPSPSSAVVRHTSVSQSVTSSSEAFPHTSDDSSDSIPNGCPAPVPPQAPRPVEETDEQIEKLLEDIMIGLNILPNIEKGNNKSQDQDLRQDGGSCEVQKNKASYCACYKNYGSQIKASREPGCTVHSTLKPRGANSALISTLENSSASTGGTDGPQNSQSPQTSSCLSENHDTNRQEDPAVLELLPLTTENEVNLFSMGDLQFLPCLSPLDSNNNATSENKTPTQPSVPERPWLTGNSCSLEFPLSSSASPNGQPELKTERKLQKAKRTCPNLRLNQTSRDSSPDTTINLSHCLVSLSSNNVLAKERKQLRSTVPSSASETNQRATTTRTLRSQTKFISDASTRTPIRTRRQSQQSQSTPITSTPNIDVPKNKRRRGRPRKKIVKVEESAKQTESSSAEKTEETQNKTRKRSRKRDLKKSPSEQATPTDDSFEAKRDDNDNDDTPPAEKRQRRVSLKEFQELIKRQHLKTQRRKDTCEKEGSEHSENGQREDVDMSDPIQEAANSLSNEVDSDEQNSTTRFLNQATNPQRTPPQAENKGTSSSFEKNNSSEVSDESEFCIGVIAEQVTKLSEEMEGGQKTSPKLTDDGDTDSASEKELTIDDEDPFPLTANTPLENTSADSSPDLPESKNGDEGDAGEPRPTDESVGCPQEDEEEVDVVLHSSPDRVSVTTEGHKSVEVSHDEEEGEDSNDVDVTGSETDA